MRIILALIMCAVIIGPAWAEDEPIVIAMKTFEIGPVQGTLRMTPQVGGVAGSPVVPTSYVLDESSNNLTDESGNKLTTE